MTSNIHDRLQLMGQTAVTELTYLQQSGEEQQRAFEALRLSLDQLSGVLDQIEKLGTWEAPRAFCPSCRFSCDKLLVDGAYICADCGGDMAQSMAAQIVWLKSIGFGKRRRAEWLRRLDADQKSGGALRRLPSKWEREYLRNEILF